ncbi:MAG: hypothetical protein H0U39_02860 [Segetibacter sp.]|nr:hypothetical protein [Segetibacter sp.]
MEKLKIVVGGLIGLYPTGGATWDYIQYPLGLKLLGHDVYYIEDSMQYPVYQSDGDKWDDCTFGVEYIRKAMTSLEMGDRWAYRDVATDKLFGMSEQKLQQVCAEADVFINVSASTYMREEYERIPARIFIDTDPMFTQFQYYKSMEEGGDKAEYEKKFMHSHTHFFTFGLNIGKEDCRLPMFDFNWKTTVKPTCINFWDNNNNTQSKFGFTSIINWVERPDFIYENESWGQKNKVIRTFEDLPSKVDQPFEIVINRPKDAITTAAIDQLGLKGWSVLSPQDMIADKDDYRTFIQSSIGEFSISKETFIKSNSGWFSGRSACYLAAGKPVITQDTQWSKYIPAGEGLFGCNDMETAIEAVNEVSSNYVKHSKRAKEIGKEYFDSDKVLTNILNTV